MARLIEMLWPFATLSAYLVVASLFIFGVHALFSEDMLFERPGNWIRSKVGEFAAKPLIDCPPCMASFWGSIIYGMGLLYDTFHFSMFQRLTIWPVIIIVLAGLLSILSGIAFGCPECEECQEDDFPEHLV